MSLLSKLKSMKNLVTGGGAQVHLEFLDEPTRDEPFRVKVTAHIEDADIKIGKVYLQLRGLESVQAMDTDVERDEDGNMEVDREVVSKSETTYDRVINVAGPEELEANGQYEWEAEVQLPPNALPTYIGRNARHEWALFAGLDKSGNDPDSGWVEFDVR